MDTQEYQLAERLMKRFGRDNSLGRASVGCFDVILDGNKRTIWLTNTERNETTQINRNISGDMVSVTETPIILAQDEPGNLTVYKNLPIGKVLLENENGVHSYLALGRSVSVEILSRANYADSHLQCIKLILSEYSRAEIA
jgi:hypothetical protein